MANRYKPRVFIGSTTEAAVLMDYIQGAIEPIANVQKWNDGFFEKNKISLPVLVKRIPEFDYAVMLFTPEDLVTFRGREHNCVRDNIVFEAGLFMSVLGIARVFIILCETEARTTRKLTDTDGLNYIHLKLFQDSAMRNPVYDIKRLKKDDKRIFEKRLLETCSEIEKVITADKNTTDIRELKDAYFATQRLLFSMIRKKGLEFEVPLMKWRFDREYMKFQDIDSGRWVVLAEQTYSYVRYVFMKILDSLKRGDEYCTVTNISFWSKGLYGVDELIRSNSEAIAKGVEIKRIMLLEKQTLNTKQHRDELADILSKFHERSLTDRISFCVVEKLPQFRAVRHIPFIVVKRAVDDGVKFLTIMPTIEHDDKKPPHIEVFFKQSDDHHHECLSLFDFCEKHKNFTHEEMAKHLNLKFPMVAPMKAAAKSKASKPGPKGSSPK